jgi:hypothetical protein
MIDPTQVVTSRGADLSMDIVLGSGHAIHDYKYLTTKSGTEHDLSITSSKSSLFYFDYVNKSLNILTTGETNELSTALGLYSYFKEFPYYDNMALGNVFVGEGITANYNNDSELVYLHLFSESHPGGTQVNETLSFSPLTQGFVSFHNFDWFTMLDNTLIGTKDVGKFDDTVVSYATLDGSNLIMVPEQTFTLLNSNKDFSIKRYDNVEFTPIYSSDYKLLTFDTWRVWNSYQDTEIVRFTPSLKLRKHRAVVPREHGTMWRMKDDFAYLQFNFTQEAHINIDGMYVMYDVPKINIQ